MASSWGLAYGTLPKGAQPRFQGGISHDLGDALAGISGLLERTRKLNEQRAPKKTVSTAIQGPPAPPWAFAPAAGAGVVDPMPGAPGGFQQFMSDPAIIAAVNAQIAGMNRPLRGKIREEKRDLKDRTGMHQRLGADFKQQAQGAASRVGAQAAERKATAEADRQTAAAEFDQRQRETAAGVQVDPSLKAEQAQQAVTQEQRLRDLMRADAEFGAKGSATMQDLMQGYASSSDAATRQSIEQDTDASTKAVRGIRDEIAANQQQRPALMMQLAQQFQQAAQQAFDNQMKQWEANQALRQQGVENTRADTALGLETQKTMGEQIAAAQPKPLTPAQLHDILKTDLGFEAKAGESTFAPDMTANDMGTEVQRLQRAFPQLTPPQIEYLLRTAFPTLYQRTPHARYS